MCPTTAVVSLSTTEGFRTRRATQELWFLGVFRASGVNVSDPCRLPFSGRERLLENRSWVTGVRRGILQLEGRRGSRGKRQDDSFGSERVLFGFSGKSQRRGIVPLFAGVGSAVE